MRMIEQHDHWHDVAHWAQENWHIITGLSATAIGIFWMILNKTFPTHEKMALCKTDLVTQIKKHEEWEDTQHSQIRHEISGVRNDVGELKNILISMRDK